MYTFQMRIFAGTTIIPAWQHRFPSAQRSYACSGSVGNHVGIPSVVPFFVLLENMLLLENWRPNACDDPE